MSVNPHNPFGSEPLTFDPVEPGTNVARKGTLNPSSALPFHGGYRCPRFFMTRPCFALSPKRKESITVDTKSFWFSVTGSDAGLALAADLDILIFLASALTERMNASRALSPELTFRPAHLLKAIHRSVDGARSYTLLEQALTRLQGTHTAMVENKAQHGPHVQFNLIERYERPTKGPWTVVVPPWFVEQVAGAKIVLIDPGYFDLQSQFDPKRSIATQSARIIATPAEQGPPSRV